MGRGRDKLENCHHVIMERKRGNLAIDVEWEKYKHIDVLFPRSVANGNWRYLVLDGLHFNIFNLVGAVGREWVT